MIRRLFGRGPEASDGRMGNPAESKPTKKEPAPETTERPKTHEGIMVQAIAEHIWNTGMTQGMEGTPEERKEIAQDMARAALALVPEKYKTLPLDELDTNKNHLVAEAVRLYKEQVDTPADQSDESAAAK